jgi:hypothetical protein
MAAFTGFTGTTVSPEAQPASFQGFGAPPPAQAQQGATFTPQPIGAPGDIPGAEPTQKEGSFLGIKPGMFQAGMFGLQVAGSVAAMYGMTGGLAALAGPLGPAGIVIGGIASAILGKDEKPYATFASTPKGRGAELEDKAFVSSKLADIGFANKGSGGGFQASKQMDQMQALADADDLLYDYLDESARKAIQSGFEWKGTRNDFTEQALADRYMKMIDYAAGSSKVAANAKQVISDAVADYRVGFDAVKSGMPDYIQELYNLHQYKRDQEAQSVAEEFLPQQPGAGGPAYIGGEEFTPYQAGKAPGDQPDIDQRIAELTAQAQVAFAAGEITTDSAYANYQSGGGKMSREMFDTVFGGQVEALVSGVDPMSAPNAVDERKRRAQAAATSGGDIAALASAVQTKEGTRGVQAGTYKGDSVPIGVADVLAYSVLGLQGNSYSDIVAGKIKSGRPVPDAESLPPPAEENQPRSAWTSFVDMNDPVNAFINARGGFGSWR